MRRLARVRSSLRALGVLNGLAYYLSVGLQRVSGGTVRLIKYDLVRQPLDMVIPAARRWGRSVDVREVGQDDPVMNAIVREPGALRSRFQQGARCLVAMNGEDLLGYLWYVEGPYREDEVRCTFVPEPEGEAVWDFDVYVVPQHRLKPVFSRLWAAAGERLRDAGYAHTCSRISAFNAASRSAHRRLGGQRVGRATFLCIGPVQLMVSTMRPYLNVCGRKGAGPRLRVG